MALLPQDRQSQYMLLITLVMVILGYLFWTYWETPTAAQIATANSEIDSLQVIIDRAKQDLASGTVEDLRRKVEQYQALLSVMRRLVPEKNEVPALIDDISTKSKVRGVTIGRFEPLAVESGSPFDTYRYRLEILGHYDQLGEFLSDIASLPRIIVPQDVLLKPAQQQAQRLLGDTLGSLLEAQFQIRTFVKAAAPPGVAPSPKRGGKPGAGEGGGGGGEVPHGWWRAFWRCSPRVRSARRRSPVPPATTRTRRWTAPPHPSWSARSTPTRAVGAIRSCRCYARGTSGRCCPTCGSWASTTTAGIRRVASPCSAT